MKRIAVFPTLILLVFLSGPATAQDRVDRLPRLEEPIQITDWWVVGPFLGGPREPLANPMGSPLDRNTGAVDLTETYPSVHQYGGEVGWQLTTVDEEGNLAVNFDNPDWEKINEEWGISGIYFSSAAYSTFQCDQQCTALVNGHGVGSFYINGRRYSGDPYGHRLIQTPVILDEGENRVFFMMGGWAGGDSVKFEILPAPDTDLIVLERDILVPDIVLGEHWDGLMGIPVLNTTERWIENISMSAGDGTVTTSDPHRFISIPPLSVLKVPVHGFLLDPIEEWPEDTIDIPISVVWTDDTCEATATARIRNPEDSRIVTFRSEIDYSVQKYGLRFPTNFDTSREYSLILTLHGAGVEAEGLVDAYEPKDWAFIVAPTNRRRFGFDWQDWGRLDAMEVLDIVMDQYYIDPNRVYLIGHSMGGHGTWHVGCTHADRFAAIVPSAGWSSFQLYVPWFLRTDEMASGPNCSRIFEQCTSPDRTMRLLPNLRNTPVLAVHGGNDDNVPPTHGRLLTGMLGRMGYDVSYWEEPGMGHWWDNSPDIPGTDCVDALRIRSFCRERERDPFPRHVTFVSYDLGNNWQSYWIRVDEEISPIGRVYVDAEILRDGTIVMETENVRRMTIEFDSATDFRVPPVIRIDGQDVMTSEWDGGMSVPLRLTPDGWAQGFDDPTDPSKYPWFRGPIKRAYFSPFVIIAGQSGTEEQNALNMEIARNLAQRWWYRANGYVEVYTDQNWIRVAPRYGHNLILIGGPGTNSLSEMYAGDLPIRIEDDGVWLSDEWIEGRNLACQFVYPRPDSSDRLIHAIWGTSLEGMRLAGGLTCLYSGSNLPDYLIYDDDVRLLGYAGVRAAGFFDNRWQVDEECGYVR